MSTPASTITELPYNAAAVVSITTWFIMVATILSVVARMSTKVAMSRSFSMDDAIIFVALALSIGQDIAVSIQSASGIGQHTNSISSAKVIRYEKASYAANILFIASITFAKISVLSLIMSITPVALHHKLAQASGLLTIVWGVASIFVASFKCSLPQPWNFISGTCIDTTAFWNAYAAINILTDMSLILIPLYILWGLSTSLKRKAVVFVCFSGRFAVIGAIIAQIYYQNKYTRTDPTFTDWQGVLAGQIVQNLSIITACIPYLKPLLESLESGMIRTDNLRPRKAGDYSGNSHSGASYRMGGLGLGSKPSQNASLGSKGHVHLGPGRSTAMAIGGEGVPKEWDRESQRSNSRMIKETRTWNVESESPSQ